MIPFTIFIYKDVTIASVNVNTAYKKGNTIPIVASKKSFFSLLSRAKMLHLGSPFRILFLGLPATSGIGLPNPEIQSFSGSGQDSQPIRELAKFRALAVTYRKEI